MLVPDNISLFFKRDDIINGEKMESFDNVIMVQYDSLSSIFITIYILFSGLTQHW